ncbi:unnamed protein product [Citrullus colocynthis]|uniref:Uncharacterized protein n=1 Tax=Citrullus colocynthis TaxID=252529 RepID=A0ABP0Z5Q8_9ROSI
MLVKVITTGVCQSELPLGPCGANFVAQGPLVLSLSAPLIQIFTHGSCFSFFPSFPLLLLQLRFLYI